MEIRLSKKPNVLAAFPREHASVVVNYLYLGLRETLILLAESQPDNEWKGVLSERVARVIGALEESGNGPAAVAFGVADYEEAKLSGERALSAVIASVSTG